MRNGIAIADKRQGLSHRRLTTLLPWQYGADMHRNLQYLAYGWHKVLLYEDQQVSRMTFAPVEMMLTLVQEARHHMERHVKRGEGTLPGDYDRPGQQASGLQVRPLVRPTRAGRSGNGTFKGCEHQIPCTRRTR